ncbi:hypothetical protein BESB_052220 [Besnoitia besnoiti]|uniref:Transmembrane protein n=1 Tax=Besnoitia besnoiti TaxID=94643 RepID=A0A2A9MH28_BESBE|nr:hypothetical protein BESB_052220 [Besnoitia besnoiti]PFH35571.1 hypothetical protein BESB_052220 [Besnoitia besnoiti]
MKSFAWATKALLVGALIHFVQLAALADASDPAGPNGGAPPRRALDIEEVRLRLLESLKDNNLRQLPGAEEALLLHLDDLAGIGGEEAAQANASSPRDAAWRAMAVGFLETVAAGFHLDSHKLPMVCGEVVLALDEIVSYLQTRHQAFRIVRWSEKALQGLRALGRALGNIPAVAAASEMLARKGHVGQDAPDRLTLQRLLRVIEKDISAPLEQFGTIVEREAQTAAPPTARLYQSVSEKLKGVKRAIDACIAFTLLDIYRAGGNSLALDFTRSEANTGA